MADPNSEVPDKGGNDAELRKLCDRHPQFSKAEWEEDLAWLAAERKTGVVGGWPVQNLYGVLVAIYRKKVVATGTDETAMRVELSKKYEVHPGRFLIRRVGRPATTQKVAAAGCSITTVAVMLALAVVVGVAAISALGSKANDTFSMIGSNVKVN